MPETRGREIHEIVEQLMRDSGQKVEDILPDILPRNHSAIGKFKGENLRLSQSLSRYSFQRV